MVNNVGFVGLASWLVAVLQGRKWKEWIFLCWDEVVGLLRLKQELLCVHVGAGMRAGDYPNVPCVLGIFRSCLGILWCVKRVTCWENWCAVMGCVLVEGGRDCSMDCGIWLLGRVVEGGRRKEGD